MAFEQRGNRSYHYEKRRIGRRVVSTYVGGGLLAVQAAEISATARQERDQRRRKKIKLRDQEKQIDRHLNEQARIITDITGQCLRLAGFHQHKGQGRKKRDGRQ